MLRDTGRIRVFGSNFLQGPLFETDSAKTIILDDQNGEPAVILSRLDNNAWVLGTKADQDWDAIKTRFGIS